MMVSVESKSSRAGQVLGIQSAMRWVLLPMASNTSFMTSVYKTSAMSRDLFTSTSDYLDC